MQKIFTVITGLKGSGGEDYVRVFDGESDFYDKSSRYPQFPLTKLTQPPATPEYAIFPPSDYARPNRRTLQVMRRHHNHIVVFYPTSDETRRLEDMIARRADRGWKVGLVGLHVTPQRALRDAFNISASRESRIGFSRFLTSSHAAFTEWVRVGRAFPEIFQRAAQMAHGAILLNNDGPAEVPVIARWVDGCRTPMIEDPMKWREFLGLADLDPARADFTVDCYDDGEGPIDAVMTIERLYGDGATPPQPRPGA